MISLHDPMDTETLGNERARQRALLQEAQQAVRRLELLTIQADQRSKVAEEKVVAAVTAVGIVRILEEKKIKDNTRDAEKFWPETYTADRMNKKSFAEFLGKVETYLRLVGEIAARKGCRLPRPGDGDQRRDCVRGDARESFRLEPEGSVRGAWTPSAQSVQR